MAGKKVLAAFLSIVLAGTTVLSPNYMKQAAAVSVKSVKLNVSSKITMYTGSSKTIKVVSVKPKGSSKKVTYKSSKPGVVTISKKGIMKARKAGTATITITSVSNKKVTKKVKVTVRDLVKNVKGNKVTIDLDKKKTVKLSLYVNASNLSFSSDKKSVVTVDKKGVLTGKKAGTAKVTIKGNKGAAKGAKQVITVEVKKKATAKPTETVKPTDTVKPTEDIKPTEAVKPTDAVKPTAPVVSEGPVIPINPLAKDSDTLLNEGIQIANGDETLHIGEFITINAVCFPYSWANQNDYVLVSSDEKVVTVDEGKIAYATGEGKAKITAYTLDGAYRDDIDVTVLPPLKHSYESDKVYPVDLKKFHISVNSTEDDPLTVDKTIAYQNCEGIMSAMKYAAVKGYDVVRLPENSLIYIDPANTIYMKSGICLDLNGSELRIVPNTYKNYQAIVFKEGNLDTFQGFAGGTVTTYDKYTSAKKFTFSKEGDSVFLEPIPVCQGNSLYNQENDTGKWVEKGGLIEITTTYIRDNNANAVFYAHYLKDGKEVFSEKKEALYGMLNNTLMTQTQTMRLTSEYDYDSVQLELRAVYGGVSNYTFCDMKIREKSSAQLHDASITNGTITGERSTKSSTYPKWASDGSTEGSCSIIFSQGVNNGIKNLTVKDSVGFNMSSGDGTMKNYDIVSYKDLESGAFDSKGNKVDCSTMIRNKEYYDVTKWTGNTYILGYHFGYQDIEQWSHSRIYDVFYYDKDKKLISYEKGLMRFRQYEMPEGTCYMNIALYDSAVPTSGYSDFGGAISFIEERDMPIRNFIVDCKIENNYSTGFAACGGQRWIIKGNTWSKNGGRMPGCDIDWEDGWNYMQCDMISDNEFLSYNNVILCAGMYSSAFYNNKFYGVTCVYPKSNFYSFVNNSFIKDTEKVSNSTGKAGFGARSDIWLYNNTFQGGVVSTEVNHSEANYRIRMIQNHFNSSMLVTNNRTDVTECEFTGKGSVTTETVENCTFKDCENLTVNGTIRNSKMENVNLNPANGEYMNILSCDLYDTNIPSTANKVYSILFEKCNMVFDKKHSFAPTDKGIQNITVKDCKLEFKDAEEKFTLFTGWDLNGSTTQALFENNTVIKPEGFHGLLINASWMGTADSENKFVLKLVNTNFDELEDANKASGNFEIIRETGK